MLLLIVNQQFSKFVGELVLDLYATISPVAGEVRSYKMEISSQIGKKGKQTLLKLLLGQRVNR